jgi:uncharacterized membrane protein YeiH
MSAGEPIESGGWLPQLMELLPYLFDLAGTFVFALSGGMAGVRRRLDVFGVLVIAFAAATAGGITRDVLIGAVPPGAISDWHYLAAALAAGIVAFNFPAAVVRGSKVVLFVDAAGLALFAVSGATKALDYGSSPVMATLLGMLTGIGGGMARDVLLAEIPIVLRADLYAVAALAGAAAIVIGNSLHLPAAPVQICGLVLCFGLRAAAIQYAWSLPTARER